MRTNNTQQKVWKTEKYVTISSEYQTQLTTYRTLPPVTPIPCSVPEAPPCYWKHRKAPSWPHSYLIPHEVTIGVTVAFPDSNLVFLTSRIDNKPKDKGRPTGTKFSVKQSNIDCLVSLSHQLCDLAMSHSIPLVASPTNQKESDASPRIWCLSEVRSERLRGEWKSCVSGATGQRSAKAALWLHPGSALSSIFSSPV